MVEITKVKTQSFMEALDTEGISNEMRQQIMKADYEKGRNALCNDYGIGA